MDLKETNGAVLEHGDLRLEFAADGAWLGLQFRGLALLEHGAESGFEVSFREAQVSVLVCIAAQWQREPDGGVTLRLSFRAEVGVGANVRGYRVEHVLRVSAGGDELDRRLCLEREPAPAGATDPGPDAFLAATLSIHGLCAAQPDRAFVAVPMARFRSAMPLTEAVRRPRAFPSPVDPLDGNYDVCLTAPDCLPGTVTLEYCPADAAARPTHVAITPLPERCAELTRVYGDAGRLVVAQEFQRELWMRPGDRFEVARQTLQFTSGDWRVALPGVGSRLAREGYAPPSDRAAWALDAIVYEAEPITLGGFRALAGQLDQIRDWGFNTIYVMPWHRGSYGTLDYLQMEPSLGTFADLRAFTDAAHERGLKVLFDLLLVIAAQGSPYLEQHPDWFYRDASGRILPHAVWGANCFDPAAPGFRRFLIDYAERCCREWGADGFRVDAAAHRGGCWHSPLGLQPHEHSHAVFTLLAEIRAALRRHKPDAILLAECFGPQQSAICDLVGFQWIMWLDWLMGQLLEGRLSGEALQRVLGEQFMSMPCDTWLTVYTHTHDTLAFAKRDPEGPAISALFATLSLLSAGTMVFGGGWGMHARPRPEEAGEYRALFAAKGRLGGVATHEVAFPALPDPALCVATRPSRLGPVTVVTNCGGVPRPWQQRQALLYSRCGAAEAREIAPYDTVVLRM